jgi:16S rRNA (uracil1498-N3)-methyltransferase
VRRRFFVEEFADNKAVLEGEAAHHLGRVLRAQQGQLYELSDGQHVWLGRIERAASNRVEFALVEEIPAVRSTLDVNLLLSVVKFDAFEWAIEKATELGVASITPVAAMRSEKALVAAASRRTGRWKKILLEASQQSRRVRVPILNELKKFPEALRAPKTGTMILLSERSQAPLLRQILPEASPSSSAALAIGPEGGWTEEEFKSAQQAGFREASLGKLILRTETAVVAALAALNYALQP